MDYNTKIGDNNNNNNKKNTDENVASIDSEFKVEDLDDLLV